MSTISSGQSNGVPKKKDKKYRRVTGTMWNLLPNDGEWESTRKPFHPDDIARAAEIVGCLANQLCCMCLRKIQVQIYMNTGVCCEQHRKDRDGDHLPAQTAF